MHRVIRKYRHAHILYSVSLAIAIAYVTTPSYADSAVMRLEPPELHNGDSEPSRGKKISLVVIDGRDASAVKTRMCGILGRDFGFRGISLLGNQEALDVILAYSIANSLEYAGFDVTNVYPDRPTKLSEKLRKMPKGIKKEFKSAQDSQTLGDFNEALRRSASGTFTGDIGFIETIGSLGAQGEKGGTNGADAVLEIRIEEFSSEYAGAGRYLWLGWSTVTMTVAPKQSGQQGVMFETEVYGMAKELVETWIHGRKYVKNRLEEMVNESYGTLVQNIENIFLSDEFFIAVDTVGGQK